MGTWRGGLVLKGYGDPALTTEASRRSHGRFAVTDHGGHGPRRSATSPTSTRAAPAPAGKPRSRRTSRRFSPRWSSIAAPSTGSPPTSRARGRDPLHARVEEEGVSVAGRPTVGTASSRARRIVRRASPPLITLLSMMDTWSDNFIAEMLLKQVGARLGTRGAPRRARRWSARRSLTTGCRLTGVRLADALGPLGPRPADGPRARGDARDDLARPQPPCAPGDVRGRRRDRDPAPSPPRSPRSPARQGKTGTTDHSSALTGFVGTRFAFAILNNGYPSTGRQPTCSRTASPRRSSPRVSRYSSAPSPSAV